MSSFAICPAVPVLVLVAGTETQSTFIASAGVKAAMFPPLALPTIVTSPTVRAAGVLSASAETTASVKPPPISESDQPQC